MRAGDARGTIGQAQEFLTKCGEYPRLRWLTYAAYNQLSEWDLAAAEATKLIESNSYDADYRSWRGITYEKKGDLAKAAEDYQQALILRPGLTDVPLNLADAYEKLGRPCDAILPLAQVVVQHPTVSNIGALQARVEALSTLPQCAWAAGEGHARIKINPGSQVMMVKVRVNDRQTGDFVVDTGATLVTLSRRFADRLQIATTGGPSLLAQTANGVTSGALVALDKLELQGIHAARVPAAVVENLGTVDGLLGMSFLSRFDLHRSQGILAIDARSSGTK